MYHASGVTRGLDPVAAWLDTVIVLDVKPSAHAFSMNDFFQYVRKRNLLKALSLEGSHRCLRRGFPQPHHLFSRH